PIESSLSAWFMCCTVFFFFQAEDGIRDFHVTGVQTCALPISIGCRGRLEPRRRLPPVEAAGQIRQPIAGISVVRRRAVGQQRGRAGDPPGGHDSQEQLRQSKRAPGVDAKRADVGIPHPEASPPATAGGDSSSPQRVQSHRETPPTTQTSPRRLNGYSLSRCLTRIVAFVILAHVYPTLACVLFVTRRKIRRQ